MQRVGERRRERVERKVKRVKRGPFTVADYMGVSDGVSSCERV
jgi:hypothetical protein